MIIITIGTVTISQLIILFTKYLVHTCVNMGAVVLYGHLWDWIIQVVSLTRMQLYHQLRHLLLHNVITNSIMRAVEPEWKTLEVFISHACQRINMQWVNSLLWLQIFHDSLNNKNCLRHYDGYHTHGIMTVTILTALWRLQYSFIIINWQMKHKINNHVHN